VPFIGAVAVDEHGHPLRAKFTQLPGFTRKAISTRARANLSPASTVISDGLACCRGVTEWEHGAQSQAGRQIRDCFVQFFNHIINNLRPSGYALSPAPRPRPDVAGMQVTEAPERRFSVFAPILNDGLR
jgi:hypothetical protein